jgi:hypothetical protein
MESENENSVPTSGGFVSSFIAQGLMFAQGLSSHSAKRFAYIHTSWVCFRAGWLMKAVHTIFDYLDSNPKNDRQVARVVANWTIAGEGGTYGGGRPPAMEALVGEADRFQFELFVLVLFNNYSTVEGASDLEMQRLLTATILLRLPQVLLCLKEHPKQVFGTTDQTCFENHRFLQKLLHAANCCNISEPIDTLKKWSLLIESDFCRRNFMFVPLKDLQRTLGEQGFDVTRELLLALCGRLQGNSVHFANTSWQSQRIFVD